MSSNATFAVFKSTRPLDPGTTDAYSIPLDTEFSTVWAFATGVTQVSYHNNNKGSTTITLPSTGGCTLGAVVATKYPYATLHGVLMWFAWSVLGVA